jgi:hypothetical protein
MSDYICLMVAWFFGCEYCCLSRRNWEYFYRMWVGLVER